ncbi:unnamed protein product [Rodentolepis nana]|uniref:Cytochrome b-c1 complex subunit Rieske, mitochondrial n=1 Tax=Rodentolepis nana TaxID=102285 RepID=A0A0R3T6M1_RODNA|nr:unnamed protein product [Rodentolepis nana]
MEQLLGDVSYINFEINDQLENQIGLAPLPFTTMNKSSVGACKFFFAGSCRMGVRCPLRHMKADKTIVCKHWLRGLCKKGDDCDFLHVYNMSKMPECYFFSRHGECSNKECLFLHVDPSTKAQDCAWYARGFCRNGPLCRNRHVRRVCCQNYLNGLCLEGSRCKLAHPKYWPLPGTEIEPHKPRWTCHYCKERGHKVQFCHKLSPEERQKYMDDRNATNNYGDSHLQPGPGNGPQFVAGQTPRGTVAVNPKPGVQKSLDEVTCYKMAAKFALQPRIVASVKSVPLAVSTSQPKSLTERQKNLLPTLSRPLNCYYYDSPFLASNRMLVSCGIGLPQSIRFLHTDVTNVPSFDEYRLDSTKNSKAVSAKTEVDRKIFTYTIAFAGTVLATTSAKYAVKTLVQTLGPSASTLAMANVEVNLATIPESKNIVIKWRNKPLFIRHRTQEMIENERKVPLSDLRHPETDEQRVKDPKWLVCIGICTHLGCVPIADAGEFGGYYCPCHGSHFDFSGRIRKGPAPTNLEVPNYRFVDENTLIVG